MKCIKYQALGNDYWVLDPACNVEIDEAVVRKLCDRHNGLGGDGVLVGPKFRGGTDFYVDIYNADGSLAEISGNGSTIFSRYLFDRGFVKLNEVFYLRPSANCHVKIVLQSINDSIVSKVVLGTGACIDRILFEVPVQLQEELSLPKELWLYKVNIGNPHCVVHVNNPTKKLACTLGGILEKHKAFPKKTNVQFVHWDSENDTASVEIFERGSGYTLGSGSSACAVACAYGAVLNKKIYKLNIRMPGGNLSVTGENNIFSFYNCAHKVASIDNLALVFE